ncbi:MAG: hypothetical protein JST73_01125 [Actinobacteria bacterium]|nr:hypothetical protein [Actinomycetota bacterium]
MGHAIARPGALFYKGTQGRSYRYSIPVSAGVLGAGLVLALVGALL